MGKPNDDIPDSQPIYSFIAYGKALARVRDPRGGDTPLVIRPQVFVRYSPAIKIANFTRGGRNGESGKNIAVVFDAASVGWRENIHAHIGIDDPAALVLEDAYKAGTPIAVGLETKRKPKTPQLEAVPIVTPIHQLRGAQEDGSGGQMTASGNNCITVIGWVGDSETAETVSDPTEWAELRNNTKGLQAPRGWKAYGSPEFGEYGFVAEDAASAASGGINLSADELEELVSRATYAALARRDQETGGGIAHENNGVPTEGKPWSTRTSDGRYNLGHYAHTHYISILGWWTRTLRNHPVWAGISGYDVDLATSRDLAQLYAQQSFDLLNKVIPFAYRAEGKASWPVDPAKASFLAAWRHLEIQLRDALDAATAADANSCNVFGGLSATDTEAWSAWEKTWGPLTSQSVVAAGSFLDEWYTAQWPNGRAAAKEQTTNLNRQRRPAAEAASPAQVEEEPPVRSAPLPDESSTPVSNEHLSEPVDSEQDQQPPETEREGTDHVTAAQIVPAQEIKTVLFASIGASWGDPVVLNNIVGNLRQRRMDRLPVSTIVDGDTIKVTDPIPNGKSGSVVELLEWRIKKLRSNQAKAAAEGVRTSGTTDDVMGVSVGNNSSRVEDLVKAIRRAATPEDLTMLNETVRTEKLSQSLIMIEEHETTLAKYLQFRLKNVAHAQ